MLRVLIVDDEQAARVVISEMIDIHCPDVLVVGEAQSVATGVEQISALKPDIVCLDIRLPDGTGFDLLKMTPPLSFEVIFLTAHEEFALEAFKVNAQDYLLKPFEPEALVEAIEKCAKQISIERKMEALLEKQSGIQNERVVLKTSDSFFVVSPDDIIWCESDAGYTTFHLKSGKNIVLSKTLKKVEEYLMLPYFLRIHQSILVNLRHISVVHRGKNTFVELSDGSKLPVAFRKREELFQLFSQFQNI